MSLGEWSLGESRFLDLGETSLRGKVVRGMVVRGIDVEPILKSKKSKIFISFLIIFLVPTPLF
jgi:hypothetical protein